MSTSDFNEDRYYEILNEAILNAITSSDEVKDILLDFKKKNLINNLAVLNLILSLEELSELIFKPESNHMYKLEPAEPGQKEIKAKSGNSFSMEKGKYSVDGRALTEKEIQFEAFCQESFDMDKWLKKNRIKLN